VVGLGIARSFENAGQLSRLLIGKSKTSARPGTIAGEKLRLVEPDAATDLGTFSPTVSSESDRIRFCPSSSACSS
jgi:hypothetical protein